MAAAIETHASQLRRFGFTVVPDVIPRDELEEVAANVLRAGKEISAPLQQHFQSPGRGAEMREGWADLAREAIAARGFEPDSASTRSVEQHNGLLHEIAAELREEHGLTDPYKKGVPTGAIDPGVNHIAHYPALSRYLADPRVLGVVKAILDPHVRVAQLEINKTNQPADKDRLDDGWQHRRGYHSDWPHDITHVAGGHVAQPFPDACMALSTVWYFVDAGPENGSTWVVPASHRDPRNPRGADDAVDGGAPIPGEMQVRASAGSVLIQDSRTWHSTATNPSDAPRTSIVCRYCPWWLSTEFSRGQFGFGGCNNARVPRDVYESMSYEAQLLFRHNVEGEPDGLHIEKHLQALRNGSAGAMKAKLDSPNEAITDFVESGAAALEELAGGEQPLAWKPRGHKL